MFLQPSISLLAVSASLAVFPRTSFTLLKKRQKQTSVVHAIRMKSLATAPPMSETNNNPPTINYMAVRDLKPGTKNMNVLVMILEQTKEPHRTKDGQEVRTFKVADKTASVNLCIFGDNGRMLRPGDICRVVNGYCSLFRGFLTAYVGKNGVIKRVGEFTLLICEEPNISEIDFNAVSPLQPPPPFVQQQNMNRPLLQDAVPSTSAQQNFPSQKPSSGGYFARVAHNDRPETRVRPEMSSKVSSVDLYRDL